MSGASVAAGSIRTPTARHRPLPSCQRAFTLIELLIVILILTILAAIAWPSFQQTIQTSRRADARVALLDAARGLERCQTRHDQYTHATCGVPQTSPEGYYRITEAQPRTATTYRLRATPIGAQIHDAESCAWLELDHRGQRTAAGTAGPSCW